MEHLAEPGQNHSGEEFGLLKFQFGSVRASSLQPARTAQLFLIGVMSLAIGLAGHALTPMMKASSAALIAAAAPVAQEIADSAPARAATDAAVAMHEAATAAISAKPEAVTREVEIGDGGSFASMLTDADVDPAVAQAVSTELGKVYDHRKLKAGQEVTLAFTRLGTEETLNGVTFQPGPTKEVSITRKADGSFAAIIKDTPIERERIAARATIHSSLFEAGEREGVPHAIMAALIRAYAHDVDFQRDIHPGDAVEVLYDQPTAKDGTPVGQGVIIYAALNIAGTVKPLYRVTFADGAVDYFDERGQSVRRALLRTPVDGARITSGFGMRIHPLLGYSKMHQGVDFGAGIGTPIFAAGSGTVEEVGFKGGYGRYILLHHNSHIDTAYAHMSRFARGMYRGAHVNQGDVIGFVGASGRATGPHLHFEVHIDRRPVNPLSVNLPTGKVLEGQTLTQFRNGQAKIKQEFLNLLAKDDNAPPDHADAGDVAAPAPVVGGTKIAAAK